MPPLPPYVPISIAERETGISKEVLRKWEARYGFPAPSRDENGERRYAAAQVRRLQLIKRLMDTGMRPAQAVGLDDEALATLLAVREKAVTNTPLTDAVVGALRRYDTADLGQRLTQHLMHHGAESFVLDIIAPLTNAIGEAWANGILKVHEEHLYAEIVQTILRKAITTIPDSPAGIRVLLATPPGELHGIGLLMVETLFRLRGARCVSLGPQVPVGELLAAAEAHRADLVGMSFSIAYPARNITPLLEQLRHQLPPAVRLWVGGAGAARARKLPAGVDCMADLRLAANVLAGFCPATGLAQANCV